MDRICFNLNNVPLVHRVCKFLSLSIGPELVLIVDLVETPRVFTPKYFPENY